MSDTIIPETLSTPARPITAQALIGLCLSGNVGIVYHLRERELPLAVRLAVVAFLERTNMSEPAALKRSYNKRCWMTELPS